MNVAPPDPQQPDAPTTRRFTVTDGDTAAALGSGSLPVLGTPRLVAWMEQVTCDALEGTLADGQSSVGTRIDVQHLAASPVGAVVEVQATPAYVDGRLHRFTVSARAVVDDRLRAVLGAGEITRVVVDAERFLRRLS